MSEIEIKGLSELNRALQDFPARMEANILRGAMRAGAKVFKDAAQDQAPVAPPSGVNARRYNGRAGALRDSVRVSVRLRNGRVQASIKAGSRDVYYAHWVEFGTAAHQIRPKGKKSLLIAGLLRESVKHPGARPKPFMRRTFDGKHRAALAAFAEYIRNRLPREYARAGRARP